MIKIVIGMPVHNCLNFTKLCIESFRKEFFKRKYPPNEIYINFVIIDNASTDGTAEYLKTAFGMFTGDSLDHIIVTFDKNHGCAKSFNKIYEIFDADNADYCILMNNDITFSENWLDHLLEFARANPEVGIISAHPIDNQINDDTKWKWFGKVREGQIGPISDEWYKYAKEIRDTEKDTIDLGLQGCLFCITKECRQAVGNWDEGFLIGCYDDCDYLLRTEKAGFQAVVTHNCIIQHFGGVSQNYVTLHEGGNWYQRYNKQYFEKKYNVNLDALGAVCCRGFFWRHPKPGINERLYF